MLENTLEPRDRAVLACAMNTGMRSGEIARLLVGVVDLDTLTLHVWVSKSLIEDDVPITSDLAAEMVAPDITSNCELPMPCGG